MNGQRPLGGLFVLLGIVSVLGFFLQSRILKPARSTGTPEDAVTEVSGVDTLVTPDEVDAGPSEPSPPSAAFSSDMDYFGGQPTSWWATEIDAAAAEETRHRLLLKRAADLGLQIDRGDAVQVTPGPPLVAALNDRKSNKRVGRFSEGPPAPTTVGGEVVRRLHPSPAHPTLILAARATERATAYLEFATGPSQERIKPGLTLLTLYALLTANSRDPFARLKLDLYEAGAELEADVRSDRAIVTLQAPPDRIEDLLRRVARMLLEPNLSSSEFGAAKRRTRQHTPSPEVATMLVNTLSLTSRSAPDADQIRESIEGATIDEVRREARSVFCPANAKIVVAGRFPVDGAIRALSGFAGGKALGREPVADVSFSGFYSVPSFQQMSLLAYPIKVDSEQTLAEALLISSILQELVLTRARRLGIAYTVAVEPVLSGSGDFLLLSVPLNDDAPSGVGDSIEEQLSAIAAKGFDEGTFLRNRSSVIRGLEALQSDHLGLASALLDSGRSQSAFGESMRVAIQSISIAEASRRAGEWLNRSKAARVEFSSRFDKFEWVDRR